MNTNPPRSPLLDLLKNPTSLVGLTVGLIGLICAVLLLGFDFLAGHENPYLGVVTFMVAPGLFLGGLAIAALGAIRMRRRLLRTGALARRLPVVDLNNSAHLKTLIVWLAVTVVLIGLSMIGAYRAYHFTESVAFCGKTCHKVMKPEHTAFLASPHANVTCTTCHIGPGADWFVKSKINGLRQVWNTAFDRFSRPIATPVHNLRPAKETCYTCHWPAKFFGSVLLDRTYFRGDEANSPWTLRMLVNVGGGDASHGRGQGIHWHMAVANKTEYIASDEKRLVIPWVRQTHADGTVTVYKSRDTNHTARIAELARPEVLAQAGMRTMDCIDCHNRPTHQYHSPERSLNEAMAAGYIDPALPGIKARASELLTGEYATETAALAAIESGLRATYSNSTPNVEAAIEKVKGIFSQNFFPEMRVSWRAYPDHIGHMTSPGCFRCHDGQHASDDGKVIRRDCNICHTIIAQGPGRTPKSTDVNGLKFEHPEDVGDRAETGRCDECHEGVPVL